jgi:hypothetical protein
MICPPCGRAGELNAGANSATDEKTADWLRTRALEAHGECWNPETCPCHHQAGDFKNTRTDG